MAIDEDSTHLPDGVRGEEETLKPGQRFGQYQIIRLLGRGGMGEVYEGRHRVLGTSYALKLIHPDVVARPEAAERFRREARVMAQLQHPHIVHVDEYGETDGRSWLRMEILAGRSIQEQMNNASKMNEAKARKILRQVLKAVAHAHGNGVVHRDLKPANLLTGADGNVKVSDFGLVRLAGEKWLQSQVEQTVLRSESTEGAGYKSLGDADTAGFSDRSNDGTSTRALMGTFAYMSPEQKRGDPADTRSDLFSIGLIAFQMLTGEVSPGFKAPSQLNPWINPAWDGWLEKSMEAKPRMRFASAKEMLAAMPRTSGRFPLTDADNDTGWRAFARWSAILTVALAAGVAARYFSLTEPEVAPVPNAPEAGSPPAHAAENGGRVTLYRTSGRDMSPVNEEPSVQAWIDAVHIQAATGMGQDSRLMLNGRIFTPGSIVNAKPKITFKGSNATHLFFVDEYERTYMRNR